MRTCSCGADISRRSKQAKYCIPCRKNNLRKARERYAKESMEKHAMKFIEENAQLKERVAMLESLAKATERYFDLDTLESTHEEFWVAENSILDKLKKLKQSEEYEDKLAELEQENAKLRARVQLLEKVREAAGYLPENPVNADRDILDCIIVEIIHAIKNSEASDDK